MKAKSNATYHRSETGWWIFKEVQYWVQTKPIKGKFSRRVDVWENTRILKAKDRETAYKKAIELGRTGMPSKTNAGVWRFAGISMLLPIYETFEDGAEILWAKRGRMSKEKALALAKPKRELEAFNDLKIVRSGA